MNGLFGPGRPGLSGGRVFGNVDTGVSVLAIVLRFTVWVLIIVAVVWVVRELLRAFSSRRPLTPPAPSPAVTELEMLYARGEISRTDYLTRRADLTGVPHTAPPPG